MRRPVTNRPRQGRKEIVDTQAFAHRGSLGLYILTVKSSLSALKSPIPSNRVWRRNVPPGRFDSRFGRRIGLPEILGKLSRQKTTEAATSSARGAAEPTTRIAERDRGAFVGFEGGPLPLITSSPSCSTVHFPGTYPATFNLSYEFPHYRPVPPPERRLIDALADRRILSFVSPLMMLRRDAPAPSINRARARPARATGDQGATARYDSAAMIDWSRCSEVESVPGRM